MIRYKCGRCGAHLESPDAMAGRKDRCPGCGHACLVPLSKAQRRQSNSDSTSPQWMLPILGTIVIRSLGNIAVAVLIVFGVLLAWESFGYDYYAYAMIVLATGIATSLAFSSGHIIPGIAAVVLSIMVIVESLVDAPVPARPYIPFALAVAALACFLAVGFAHRSVPRTNARKKVTSVGRNTRAEDDVRNKMQRLSRILVGAAFGALVGGIIGPDLPVAAEAGGLIKPSDPAEFLRVCGLLQSAQYRILHAIVGLLLGALISHSLGRDSR